jgi:hypothetical protein
MYTHTHTHKDRETDKRQRVLYIYIYICNGAVYVCMRVQKEREREGDVMGLFEQVERVGPVRNTIYGGFWETRVMPVKALRSPSCRSAPRMLTYAHVLLTYAGS